MSAEVNQAAPICAPAALSSRLLSLPGHAWDSDLFLDRTAMDLPCADDRGSSGGFYGINTFFVDMACESKQEKGSGTGTERGCTLKVRVIPYTPGEAAIASGRSVENARNDRRAGYAEKQSGHARYDLLGVARLFVIQMFADRGIGPSISVKFADEVAGAIAFHAAARGELWTADAINAAGVDASSISGRMVGTASELRRLTSVFDEKYRGYSSLGAGIVVWPTNEYDIITKGKFWGAVGKLLPLDERAHGVVCMLQFFGMGRILAERMPRPIFDLEAER